jgi:hypothetical protein
MPNAVSAIDGTSHEIQIPFNEPQQKKILSANQLVSFIDMKERLSTVIIINSINISINQFLSS